MKKDDATILQIFYVVFALIIGFVAWSASGTFGTQTGWAERYDEWFGVASTVVSVLVGAAAAFVLAGSKERHDYFLASIGELRKVTWPGFLDTRRMTIVVCAVVGVFAVILAVFDFMWAKLLGLILV